jgi:asparagine synthetase B (glutamine-hydrolysing)
MAIQRRRLRRETPRHARECTSGLSSAPQHQPSITTFVPPAMCGIFCSISRGCSISPDQATKQLLQNRGPDSIGQREVLVNAPLPREDAKASAPLHVTFLSTVLSLRGTSIVEQPVQDAHSGSTLCWNGEAWTVGNELVTGNDSQLMFAKLISASSNKAPEESIRAVVALLTTIRGPYAFVFYDAVHRLVYYGRDCLGRRSLLRKTTLDDTLILSSVCDNASGESWTEVEANGIYIVDLNALLSNDLSSSVGHVPHRLSDQPQGKELSFVGKSVALDSLLISQGFAISADEPHHARQSVG